MIQVTRLNGQEMVLNAELIETVEATPDTVISLTTGRKVLVRESPEEVTSRVVAYRRSLLPRGCAPAGCVSGDGAMGARSSRCAVSEGRGSLSAAAGRRVGTLGRGSRSEVEAP